MAKSRKPEADEPRRRRPDDDDEKPRKRAKAKDDEDEDEDEEAEEDDGPQKPRKKRKSAKGPMRTIFIIIGSVAGAVGLFLLLYWIYSPMGTDHRLLCYAPPETFTLMGYDVADNAANLKMKEVHDVFLNNYKRFGDPRFTQACGLTEKDVERYLSGAAAGDPQEEEKEEPQNRRGSFTIIRFKKEIDQKKFIDSFTGAYKCEETASPDGKTFYRLTYYPNPNTAIPDISFFFPNDRTLMYTSTRKELTEALKRQPGKVELEGTMRELADKVDGQYFSASKNISASFANFGSPRFGFTGGFLDQDLREGKLIVSVGSATWFASNGNDFMYANGELYADREMAKSVRLKLYTGYEEARVAIYADETKPKGAEDMFFPKTATGGGGDKEAKQAAIDAMVQYVKTFAVVRRGSFVAVSGMISHENFDKLWKGISSRYQPQQGGFGGFGPGGGGPPMPPGGGGPP